MKSELILLVLLALSVQTAEANDIEKVMNKALGSGKSSLLKQAGNVAKSQLLKDKSPAVPATPATAALPATPAATAAATTAAAATPATPALPAAGKVPATPAAAGTSGLKDKLMHRAAVEGEKYAKKYGDKYLKQGKGQLGKFLN